MPNASQASPIPIGENYVGIINVSGVGYKSGTVLTIPRTYPNYEADVYISGGNLIIETFADYSTYTALITVEYYK